MILGEIVVVWSWLIGLVFAYMLLRLINAATHWLNRH